MIAGEGRADGNVGFKSAAWSVENEFRGHERIVFMQFEDAVVETTLIRSFQIKQAEVKI
jgi:hypothetical protein